MYDVFISYSTFEKETAERICIQLEKADIPCWIAPRDVMPGSHWAASIAQAVRNAKIMVLLFSEYSNDSEQVAREINLAANNRLVIIPLKIDDTVPNDMMEYYLSVTHWLDINGKSLESAADEIIEVVRGLLNQVSEASLLQELPSVPKSKDSMLDIYDGQMDWIGTALRRGVHAEGLWHKTFHCWFVSHEDGRTYVWVQKRSFDKADFPGLLDITAARHLLAGESDREGIGKINLELGVDVDFEDVHYLGIRTYAEKLDAFYNREFNSVYLYDSFYSLSDFDLQTHEVSGILKIGVEDGLRLLIGEAEEITAVGSFIENGQKKIKKQRVTLADFVPREDDYYQKIFLAAKEFFAGNKQLSL